MTESVARAVMALAVHCLGRDRREWAAAMQAEFGAARADGKALAFAGGCLIAGVRELPRHAEGRFAVANHLLALLVILPVSALLVSSVISGFPGSYLAQAGMEQQHLVNDSNRSAVPSLLILVLLLAGLNLRMAWLTLERDWTRLVTVAAQSAGATATLLIFSAVAFASHAAALAQLAALAVQLAASAALARWHGRLESADFEVG